MIHVVCLFLIVLTLIYAGLNVFYLVNWIRLRTLPDGISDAPYPLVSVLVPARNEESRIAQCLESLVEQDYAGEYEVLIIDDGSEDDTAAIADRFSRERGPFHLIRVEQGGRGKKAALATGISRARGEVVITTDADCILPPGWLRSVSEVLASGCDLVTGPVIYVDQPGFFSAFQQLDLLALMIVSGGGWNGGLHHLSNGANMGFTKRAYRSAGGYAAHAHLASGDDLFLVQELMKSDDTKAEYLKGPSAIVRSYPERSLAAFIQQRLRWASKNRYLPEKSVTVVWGVVWVFNVLLLGALIACAGGLLSVAWVAACTGVKALVDLAVLITATRQTQNAGILRWFVPAFAVHLLYVVTIGILALLRVGFTWKGRVYAAEGS